MKSFVGFKTRICPTKDQEVKFRQYAGVMRFVWNWALRIEMDAFENGEKFVSAKKLKHMIVVLKKSDPNFAFLNSVSCHIPKAAIDNLIAAFDKYFKEQKKPNYVRFTQRQIEHAARIGKKLTIYDSQYHPKFKSRKNTDFSFFVDGYDLQIHDNIVNIPKIGDVRCRNRHRGKSEPNIPEKLRGKSITFCNPKVSFDGKYWILSLSIEEENPPICEEKTEPIGVDLGIKSTAVISDGTVFRNINKDKKMQKLTKRKKRLQRKLARKYRMNNGKKTKNMTKLQRQLRKLDRKMTNIKQNFRHQLTNSLVKREPSFIVIEDLNVRGMLKNRHLSKAISDQSFNLISKYLLQKCKRKGIKIIIADRFYPSSKTCSNCGNIKRNLKLSDRTFTCESCNFSIDRDLNAAINLLNYGMQIS